jgi:hypothetical protein
MEALQEAERLLFFALDFYGARMPMDWQVEVAALQKKSRVLRVPSLGGEQ